MITLTTSFRTIPNLSLQNWKDEFKRLNSPLTSAEIEDCFHASQGWAVALDQAIGESSLRDSAPVQRKNLLNLMDENGFKSYPKHWMSFTEYMRRLYDPGYKSGVYYPASLGVGGIVPGYDLSLAGYKVIYQGGPGCLSSRGKTCANGETYDPAKPMLGESVVRDTAYPSINRSIAASMLRYDRWFDQVPPVPPGPEPPPTGEVVFGRVSKPAINRRLVPDSLNSSWDYLGKRRLFGVVYHRMLGTLWGTDAYFRQHAPGLTDWGMDHNTGELLQWVDYTGAGHPGVSPNKSPWASGGSGGSSGDGAAFTTMFGREAVNRDLSAIEISGNQTTPMGQSGIDQLVILTAYLADQAKVRYDTFPLNPNTGLVFTYFHNEFQREKDCPWAEVERHIDAIIDRSADLMKKHQVG
jgi:hypothetical protein